MGTYFLELFQQYMKNEIVLQGGKNWLLAAAILMTWLIFSAGASVLAAEIEWQATSPRWPKEPLGNCYTDSVAPRIDSMGSIFSCIYGVTPWSSHNVPPTLEGLGAGPYGSFRRPGKRRISTFQVLGLVCILGNAITVLPRPQLVLLRCELRSRGGTQPARASNGPSFLFFCFFVLRGLVLVSNCDF